MKTRGTVRFNRNPDGGTRVTIHWDYTPPAGAIGHTVASLLGADPKQAMDRDLARLKTLFETGKTTVAGKEIRLEEVERSMSAIPTTGKSSTESKRSGQGMEGSGDMPHTEDRPPSEMGPGGTS
jgi:hypothetical protein